MTLIPVGVPFPTNSVLTSSGLNAKFGDVVTTCNTYAVFTDVARTITAIMTFSAVPVFSAGITISSGGLAITGNSTVTGTLGVTGTLTASGGMTVTGSGASISALSAGNTAITGTLSVSGAVTLSSTISSLGHTITGTCTATLFSGSGASLTSLPAANLTGSLGALNGSALTNLNASALTTGTVSNGLLPTTISVANVLASNNMAAGGFLSVAGTAGITFSSASSFLMFFPAGCAFDTGTGLVISINGVLHTIAYT